ncbi:MAG TPA: vitamin B12 dependent-methionine synthase activation domain-containing protein [Candidatus Deferrimicrobium sp.]|nr:vitamin B12 dependent-methionine synthase activation domain-containing protein [Candidatus Deferrimicrobium sp.]
MIPDVGAVLTGQGVPPNSAVDERTRQLAQQAIDRFRDLASPQGIILSLGEAEFARIYDGAGMNEADTPLARIYPESDCLALFAVTVGEDVSREITRLFSCHDYAAGAMLDCAASVGAELAAEAVERHVRDHLIHTDRFSPDTGLLSFSPGYCGWHVSAQRKLFDFLRPEEIGITLNESHLMTPLKSISGVIVAGPREIFQFEDNFPFCSPCETHSCQDRIRSVFSGRESIR